MEMFQTKKGFIKALLPPKKFNTQIPTNYFDQYSLVRVIDNWIAKISQNL